MEIKATNHPSLQAEAISKAIEFIRNGVEFGYIRMPDENSKDPAHNMLPLLLSAEQELRSLDQSTQHAMAKDALTQSIFDKSDRKAADTFGHCPKCDHKCAEAKSIGKLTFTVHTNTTTLQRTINDLLASDEFAKSAQTVDEYRDAMANAIEKRFAETIQISEQIALMPRALTAENGAKSAMMASFHEVVEHSCQHCDDGEECELCNGTGTHPQKVPVSWTTIKAIYAKAVEVCEVKSIS